MTVPDQIDMKSEQYLFQTMFLLVSQVLKYQVLLWKVIRYGLWQEHKTKQSWTITH